MQGCGEKSGAISAKCTRYYTCGCNRPLYHNQRRKPYNHPSFDTKLGWLFLHVWTDDASEYRTVTTIISLRTRKSEGMKAVPGRKTDTNDVEWIADLLQHGLLRSSYIPDKRVALPRASSAVTAAPSTAARSGTARTHTAALSGGATASTMAIESVRRRM